MRMFGLYTIHSSTGTSFKAKQIENAGSDPKGGTSIDT